MAVFFRFSLLDNDRYSFYTRLKRLIKERWMWEMSYSRGLDWMGEYKDDGKGTEQTTFIGSHQNIFSGGTRESGHD